MWSHIEIFLCNYKTRNVGKVEAKGFLHKNLFPETKDF